MELIRWSYARRKVVRAYFDKYPVSTFYFRKIRSYYYLYSSEWNENDPVITGEDKEQMHLLINDTLGRRQAYENRKSVQYKESYP
ncbi:hypothetical protein [Salimicrobium flavidum]|uniref:Uncharacterized protein n=1 Tax=Salimicrobium flavidum TaxID=570947 RepID=A0A1N7JTI4_9BACI|nr:hypothetical protein [Salimicrobium flavidum]SIS52672.1 hypothetical protein SAMN05421687_107164 [Salimicrobium flavidum]